MVFTDLINNIALLLSLCILYSFLIRGKQVKTFQKEIITGLLFGTIAIAGMLVPFKYMPGIIFDGRSIIISLAGVFGGPWTAAVSALMASGFRLWLGGAGEWTGVSVILMSAVSGVGYRHFFWKKTERFQPVAIYFFGVIVHICTLLLMLTLPGSVSLDLLAEISLPVMLMFPLGTLLLAILLNDQESRNAAVEALSESEKRYRRIVETSREGIWGMDAQQKTTFVNSVMADMLGYTAEEMIGRPVTDFMFEEDLKDHEQIMDSRVKGVGGFYERKFRRKNGDAFWTIVSATPVLAEDHSFAGSFAMFTDITERKKMEERIRVSEEKYRLHFENVYDVIYSLDSEFKIVSITPSVEKVLGYRQDELIGRPFLDLNLLAPEFVESAVNDTIRILGGEKIQSAVYVFIAKDGSRKIGEVSGSPIMKDGKIISIVSNARDITDKVKLEEKLRHSQKMEAVSTLSGGFAHDFNNILGVILGNAELALDDVPETHPAHVSLEEIKTASLRAKDVIRQIITFIRVTDEKKAPVHFTPVFVESLRILKSSIPPEISISENISARQDLVLANHDQIRQIIRNLSSNAIEAMKPGGGELTFELKNPDADAVPSVLKNMASAGNFLQFSVHDTGHGIDAGILDRVFDPYFTTRETGKRKGAGLGLSVVHGLVESLNGQILVSSRPGETTFDLFLPLTETVEASPGDVLSGKAMGRERILVIDDDPSLLKMNERIMTNLGYQVRAFSSPLAALEYFKTRPDRFDAVFTDMIMTEMNGLELIGEIKKIRPDIAAILCTGHSDLIDMEKLPAMGVTEYVMKPLTRKELGETLRKVFDAKHIS